MASPVLWKIGIADDVDREIASRLTAAVLSAPLFSDAPALHMATPERRAREVKKLVGHDYPEGTPERLSRELLRRFAPHIRLRGDVERDFDFFGALAEALRATGGSRRVSRSLVEQLLEAWRRVAQVLPPGPDRAGPWLDALGERGALLRAVMAGYLARLDAAGAHDPEDAPWLAARLMPQWAARRFAPQLVVVQDLDRVWPARLAFVEAALRAGRSALCIARGNSDLLPFVREPNEALAALVDTLGGAPALPPDLPRRQLADTLLAWAREEPLARPAALNLLRPATRAAEVRQTAREIKRAARDGVPLSHMAVVMPRTDAYADLVAQEFSQAGIAFDSPFELPLADAPPVAAVLELLRVAHGGLERLPLLDALRSPWLPFGAGAHLDAVAAATREAGIVGGTSVAKDWRQPLENWCKAAMPGKAEECRRHSAWLLQILELLVPLSGRAMQASRFFDTVENLLRASGARRVANTDAQQGATARAAMHVDALFQFARLLVQMRAQFAAQADPVLTTGELIRALTEQARARTVRPPEKGGERVRVLGLREVRGAAFARLWVLGLTDGDLPLPGPETMFLPAARKAQVAAVLGEETAARLCAPVDAPAQADYLYACALAAAEHVTLMLPAADGETPFVPATPHARLLACLDLEPTALPPADDAVPVSRHALAVCLAANLCRVEAGEPTAAPVELTDPALLAGMHGRRMELSRGDAAALPGEFEGMVGALPELARRFGPGATDSRLFSPSQFDVYAECPQRFWARYVIGVKPVQEPTLDTPAWAVGTLLHTTFEKFVLLLRREAGQPETLPDPAARQPVNLLQLAGGNTDAARELGHRLVARAFEQACAEHQVQGPFWSGLSRLITSGLAGAGGEFGRGVLARFVEHELARNAEGYGVRFTEFSFGKDATGPDALSAPVELPVPGGSVRLQGSVDRVDEGPRGLEIVDYKTGKAKTTAEVRDGVAFQLPLYLAAISRVTGTEPAGMSYLKTPVEEELERDDVTLLRGQPAYDVADLVRNRLPQRLANMVSAMTAGLFVHVPFVPVNKACQYCDYAAGCAVRGPVAAERRLRFAAGRAMTGLYLPDVETP
ncbi:MAG: PD-(D/E)XK nuclease family protein [Planctomycetes bacterium]|nr:PD-(D/E)XK nuclease family protein [Planctomycetota bacterium]MCL4729622.1 PD-(D/E)XK nuclease family protein [Planctomycetota bacterium]